MTWQDLGVFVIVGAAVAYVIRKFMPRKPAARAATFVSIQQLKSRSRTKSEPR